MLILCHDLPLAFTKGMAYAVPFGSLSTQDSIDKLVLSVRGWVTLYAGVRFFLGTGIDRYSSFIVEIEGFDGKGLLMPLLSLQHGIFSSFLHTTFGYPSSPVRNCTIQKHFFRDLVIEAD